MKAGAVALFAFVVLGCGPHDAVQGREDYEATLGRARALALEPLKAFEDGRSPEGADERDLREARRLFSALIEFAPGRFSLYVGAAQIDAALDDRVSAVRMARQALANAPAKPDAQSGALVGEAHYLLALVAFREGQFRDAEEQAALAIGFSPQSPKFRTMRASALIQLGEEASARREIDESLRASPTYPPALRLDRLLRAAERG